ncbi:hypothetical protein HY612_02065 [Candidatus Roizmanbacteria bacterium]|nr:hypothetical protein [Candidatus Roizmanbacteria bacterium]
MQEPTVPELSSPNPATEAQQIAAERPQDDKNRVITRLKKISSATQKALAEQKLGNENHVFNQKADQVIELGDAYTKYLEDHMSDPDLNAEIFNRIAFLAKNSLLMNIEPYVAAISERFHQNQFIADYIKQHSELAALDTGGKGGPWSGIKEPLYFSAHNDIRERYREAIIRYAQDLIASGDFSPRDVDHLERFLVGPQGRMPSEYIPEYLRQHASEIQQWTPLSLNDFQEYVVAHLGNYQGEMSQNDFLRQLDEEIASIKPKDIKGKYSDRVKKLAFIRDLRFGRVNIDELKTEVVKRAAEITRRADLRTLAPHLKQQYPVLLKILQETVGQTPATRRQQVETLLVSANISQQDADFVRQYLEANLK